MFAPLFAPLTNPEALVNAKLAIALQSHGWKLDVVSYMWIGQMDLVYNSTWTSAFRSLRECVHPVTYVLERNWRSYVDIAYSILRTGHPVKGIKVVPEVVRVTKGLLEHKTYDLIISRGLPNVAHVPAMLTAQRQGIPWIANWNDPPDNRYPPVNLPEWREKRSIVDIFQRRLARRVMRKASMVSFPCSRLRDYTARLLGLRCVERSVIIPHIGTSQMVRQPKRKFRSGFVLCHAGTLVSPRRVDLLLEAIAALPEAVGKPCDIRLKLIGIVDARIKEIASRLGIGDCIEFRGKMGHLETLEEMYSSDVLLLVEAPCEEGIFLPSKFVDYAQTGQPILAISPRVGTVSDLLAENGGGVAADCQDPGAVLSALKEMYLHWDTGGLTQAYRSATLQKLFDPDKIVDQYASICSSLLESGGNGD
jgi:glycosyltransferase involved in cell wall biosynthesis